MRDDTVSRRHAEIRVTCEDVTVNDLGSRNGTFVDSQRVKTAPLEENQHVAFGSVSFFVTSVPEFEEIDSGRDTAACEEKKFLVDSDDAVLSRAQRRVLAGLLKGQSRKEIAKQLYLSLSTVNNHIQAIYRILKVHSAPELLARFLKKTGRRFPDNPAEKNRSSH